MTSTRAVAEDGAGLVVARGHLADRAAPSHILTMEGPDHAPTPPCQMPIARPDPISPEENGSTIITTNRTFNQWSKIFAGDAVQTSAVLDRILHHCETVVIEGGSKAGMYLPFRRRPSVNHGVLESLNLISHEDDVWQVTNLGQAFLETVSEPKRKDEKPATAASK